MTERQFKRYDFKDGSIEWHCADLPQIIVASRGGIRAPYWRTAGGKWAISDAYGIYNYPLDEWLTLVDLPEEEKLMLKLTYG